MSYQLDADPAISVPFGSHEREVLLSVRRLSVGGQTNLVQQNSPQLIRYLITLVSLYSRI